MENSMTSMSKPIPPKERTVDSEEESSWTFYFEDFLCNDNEEHSSDLSSGYEIPSSLVSDAASSVTKKFKDNDRVVLLSLDESRKKLMSFKKRKTKGVLADIDALELEDTASSPVNSPKVCYLDRLDMNGKDKDDTIISEEKGNKTSGHTDERSDQLSIVGRDSDYTELKKRGLCLVPLSMLASYYLG